MLSRVAAKDYIQLKLSHHTVRHVISVLCVTVLGFGVIAATGYILHLGTEPVSSPQKQVVKVTDVDPPKDHQEAPAPIPPKSAEQPALKHDYVIPPVVGGIPPVVTNFHTEDPVVFLTIDDGAFKDPSVVQIIKDNNLKVSVFLAKAFINDDPDFFKQLIDLGALVENHSISHDLNMVNTMSYQEQVNDICGMADYEEQVFGRRPIFFRPPGGAYSDTMLQAAGACGMRAVVTWIAKANGGSMQYQIGDHLRPGDIVLMHFRPEFARDMQAFLDAQNAAGLHTELLEDWI
jgi:peptidoglycan-N-acetylglucosamine deacetylase